MINYIKVKLLVIKLFEIETRIVLTRPTVLQCVGATHKIDFFGFLDAREQELPPSFYRIKNIIPGSQSYEL